MPRRRRRWRATSARPRALAHKAPIRPGLQNMQARSLRARAQPGRPACVTLNVHGTWAWPGRRRPAQRARVIARTPRVEAAPRPRMAGRRRPGEGIELRVRVAKEFFSEVWVSGLRASPAASLDDLASLRAPATALENLHSAKSLLQLLRTT